MTQPKIVNINHLAIVVTDIQEALTFWRDALGLEIGQMQEVESQAVKTAFLPLKDSEIELVEPVTEDSSVKRYLEKRGPGMHHLCLEVDDLEAMLDKLKTRNVRLINDTPQEDGIAGRKFAFIHPESTFGVLLELYQISGK